MVRASNPFHNLPDPGKPFRDAGKVEQARLAVVRSVSTEALRVWVQLWEQFEPGVTQGGMVLQQMQQGFKPACGWAEFLETFWLLKYKLEYLHRFCAERPCRPAG